MVPLFLKLQGFRGIRDGLGRDKLALNLEQLAGGAELVAIAGANGRGKTTVLDNLHPFLTMPSRATSGQGVFSYYEHVCLPENLKELIWEHEGRRYRSLVVIRSNGRKSTEAFLFALDENGNWQPAALPDGTVSDGKTRTYTRCVEYLLGSADTFFLSVFSAQNKRPLSAYQNAEIKSLLADLLGQERIRALGRQSSEVAGLLKVGLGTIRQEQQALDEQERRLHAQRERFAQAAESLAPRLAAKQAAQRNVDEAQACLAARKKESEYASGTEEKRSRLNAERQEVIHNSNQSLDAMGTQGQGLHQHSERLHQRIASRRAQALARRQDLLRQRDQCGQAIKDAWAVSHAARRQPLAEKVLATRKGQREGAHKLVMSFKLSSQELDEAHRHMQALEREAGQAALRSEDLTRRFGLVNEVPCKGTSLQGQCTLLGDAATAKDLLPNAQVQIQRLAEKKAALEKQIKALTMQVTALESSPGQLAWAERLEERALKRANRHTRLAARSGEIGQARRILAETEAGLAALPEPEAQNEEERTEQADIEAALLELGRQRHRQQEQVQQALSRVDQQLASLPPPFDNAALAGAEKALAQAQTQARQAEEDYLQAVRDAESLAALDRQGLELAAGRQATSERANKLEKQLGEWNLLTKCLGNDGLIALAIDDAGPALAGLANELLLDCYGPRFTVSIMTQVETGKGEQREGFEILVHDGESGQAKRVEVMSGGERVWVNECLVRAVALYLSMHTGRQYGTLFCDEVDGPLDPGRKRMMMAMKRAVLRLGGYSREFFISQSPELAGMADAVIELGDYMQ